MAVRSRDSVAPAASGALVAARELITLMVLLEPGQEAVLEELRLAAAGVVASAA
jgi:hypothetical protein